MTILRYVIIFVLVALSAFCMVLVWVDPKLAVPVILHWASMDGFAHQILERMEWSTALRMLLGFESLLAINLIYFVPTILSGFQSFVTFSVSKVRMQLQKWNHLEAWTTFFVWIALLIAHLVLLSKYTLLEDEAFGMVHFVSKGFFTVVGYYPGPNNHVWYNLMVWVLYTFGMPAYWSLKIPSLIATHLLLGLFYFIFRFRWGWKMTLLGIGLLLGSELVFSYALLGRGYLWLALGSWVALVGVTYEKPNALPFRLGCFVIGSWIAFASVPSYLFCFVGLCMYLGWIVSQDKQWKPWGLGCLMLVFLTVAFYLPIFILNPLRDIFQNTWVKSMQSADWVGQWTMYAKNICFEVLPLIIPALLLGKWPWSTKKNVSIRLWFCLVGGAFVVLFIQKVWPYDRVWMYFPMVWVVMLVEGIFAVKWKTFKWGLVAILVLFHLNIFVKTLNERWNTDGTDLQLARKIITAPYPVLTNEITMYTYILYATMEKNATAQISYGKIDPKNPECMVVAKSNSIDNRWLNTHQKVYSSKLVDIFVPKNSKWKIQ